MGLANGQLIGIPDATPPSFHPEWHRGCSEGPAVSTIRRKRPGQANRVLLRITRRVSGSIDGIQLGDFAVGLVYEVGTSLGCYLLAERIAEPVSEPVSIISTPGRTRFRIEPPSSNHGRPARPVAEAADKPRKRKP